MIENNFGMAGKDTTPMGSISFGLNFAADA